MSDIVRAMVEHYQKTYELTYDLWTQRNRTFLWLLGSVAAATLLTFSPEGGNTLLVALIAKSLEISDAAVPRASISMTVLQGIILLVVFYFMVNLYHVSHQVIRNYQHLGALEREVRGQLNLGADSVFFTREGTFY